MSGWAGDKDRRAPLAALLILFGFLLGAGSVTSAEGVGGPGARLVQSGKAPAHILPGGRAILSDEEARPDAQPFVPPTRSAVVVGRSTDAPMQQGGTRSPFNPHQAPTASYRARAPPAA